jgi:hypothetical protein
VASTGSSTVSTPVVAGMLRRARSTPPESFQTSTFTGSLADRVTRAWYRPGGRSQVISSTT